MPMAWPLEALFLIGVSEGNKSRHWKYKLPTQGAKVKQVVMLESRARPGGWHHLRWFRGIQRVQSRTSTGRPADGSVIMNNLPDGRRSGSVWAGRHS